jgi:DinB superfamily
VTAPDPAELLAAARAELARAPGVLAGLVSGLDGAAWRARPAPAEWAPVEIVCHLRDEETEDFGARVRVITAGRTRFKPIDPERWAVERRYLAADGPEALAAFRERRTANLAFLATLAVERLTSLVTHARTGGLSGLDLLAAWVAHDRLHVAQLAATLTRGWADRWAPLRSDYAGPIPYPPATGTAPSAGSPPAN